MHLTRTLFIVLAAAAGAGCERSPGRATGSGIADGVKIAYYRLRAPGSGHDIEQASGLHYGRLGERDGLWLTCDRNGGGSAGRLYFISAATLKRATHQAPLVADEVFPIVLAEGDFSAFAAAHPGAGRSVLAEVHRRLQAGLEGRQGPLLDLEAVTIAPSPSPPHEPRVFVVAEEPFSTVLELALEGEGQAAKARLTAVYAYQEADDERGTDRNDGIEGLAYAGRVGEFYWAEEGTKSHGGGLGAKLFFLNPRLGRARFEAGQVMVDREASDALTAAVRAQRRGKMQTLNALAAMPDGRLLAVDRNGGWILRVDPDKRTAQRWLNLYDLHGTNLREALGAFPAKRRMPYVSIEGIAVDRAGTLWLVDDPAMPEGFRASCLVRITGYGWMISPAASAPGTASRNSTRSSATSSRAWPRAFSSALRTVSVKLKSSRDFLAV